MSCQFVNHSRSKKVMATCVCITIEKQRVRPSAFFSSITSLNEEKGQSHPTYECLSFFSLKDIKVRTMVASLPWQFKRLDRKLHRILL